MCLHFDKTRPLKAESPGFPLELEIRFGIKEGVFVPLDLLKTGVSFYFLHHPVEVFGVICFEEKFSLRRECLVQ